MRLGIVTREVARALRTARMHAIGATRMAKQRRFPRARLSFDSDVWVERPGGPTHIAGRFVVLGAGGACLELNGTFSIGNLLDLWFTLPETRDTISSHAIVRSAVEGGGVGVEFLDISPQERERVTACVQRYITAGFADQPRDTA